MCKRKQLGNKGFTLLEVLIAMILSGMVMWYSMAAITFQARAATRIANQVNPPKRFKVVYFPVGACNAVDNYWGKQVDPLTVMVYTDSSCKNALGTLNQNNNSTYFNDITSTLWVISSSVSGLRALVINL